MITIYHLEQSRSERVIWLMEELGLPYELKRFRRQPDMRSEAALREVHPLGKSPMIRDGRTLLIESGAILEYIANRHGGGRLTAAVDSPHYPAYLQWLHFAEGSVMPQFVLNLFLSGFVPGVDQSSAFVQSTKAGSTKLVEFMNAELEGRTYLAGDSFTIADLIMVDCFRMLGGRLGMNMDVYPALTAWIARIEGRPAYKKAMAIANEKTD